MESFTTSQHFKQSAEESALVAALREGDEAAFAELIRRNQAAMLRTARTYVSSRAVAEDVVSESWLAVLEGIDRFEGRARVMTWVFGILINQAKTRGRREARTVPFSSLGSRDEREAPSAVAYRRAADLGASRSPSMWSGPGQNTPHERALSREVLGLVGRAIGELPERQAKVIGLRDVAGWSAREVCEALELGDGNQRLLLHRARSKVRAALESYVHSEALM